MSLLDDFRQQAEGMGCVPTYPLYPSVYAVDYPVVIAPSVKPKDPFEEIWENSGCTSPQLAREFVEKGLLRRVDRRCQEHGQHPGIFLANLYRSITKDFNPSGLKNFPAAPADIRYLDSINDYLHQVLLDDGYYDRQSEIARAFLISPALGKALKAAVPTCDNFTSLMYLAAVRDEKFSVEEREKIVTAISQAYAAHRCEGKQLAAVEFSNQGGGSFMAPDTRDNLGRVEIGREASFLPWIIIGIHEGQHVGDNYLVQRLEDGLLPETDRDYVAAYILRANGTGYIRPEQALYAYRNQIMERVAQHVQKVVESMASGAKRLHQSFIRALDLVVTKAEGVRHDLRLDVGVHRRFG